MTVNLSIKGVPADIAERLRARAERNHRSLQGELMAIIEQAAQSAAIAGDPLSGHLAGKTPEHASLAMNPYRRDSIVFRRGSKTIEQIAAEHLAMYPEPFHGLPLAVDIIRKDRDSR